MSSARGGNRQKTRIHLADGRLTGGPRVASVSNRGFSPLPSNSPARLAGSESAGRTAWLHGRATAANAANTDANVPWVSHYLLSAICHRIVYTTKTQSGSFPRQLTHSKMIVNTPEAIANIGISVKELY
jgi:hypothetical protein